MIPILIPAYEPDKELISYCRELSDNGFKKIIVIDDGSGSKYRHIFKELEKISECEILRHAVNLGKGRALKDAFNYLLITDPDLIGCVTADSDGQHRVKDVLNCVERFNIYPDKMVLGVRNFNLDIVPEKSKFGNKLTRNICKYLLGLDISDTQTGLRVIPKILMKKCLETPGERFEYETNMLIESQKACICIEEVSIETVYDSKTDHMTHFDPIKDSVRIYKIFAAMFMKYIFSSFSASLLDLFIFTVLCGAFRSLESLNYIIIATWIARLISATYNFCINYHIVFESKKNKLESALKYIVLAISQMVLSAALVICGVYLFKINETIVKIIVDSFLFFISYSIQRKFVY